MPKFLVALLFGLAVMLAFYYFSNPLIEWSGGRPRSNVLEMAFIYGFLGACAVVWPSLAAIIAAAVTAFVLLMLLLLGGFEVVGRARVLLTVGAHGLPFVLPYLWSVAHFDLFRNRKQAA